MTKFLAGCHICKKSARPFSPSRLDDTCTESSSELDALHSMTPPSSVNNDSTPTSVTEISKSLFVEAPKVEPLAVVRKDEAITLQPSIPSNAAVVDWEEAINLETTKICAKEKTDEIQPPSLMPFGNISAFLPSREPVDAATAQANMTYFDEVYSKITEYYSYQLNNNADIKDLATSNELMNYYQLLRTFYEKTLAVHKSAEATKESHHTETIVKQEQIMSQVKDEKIATAPDESIIDLTISKPSSVNLDDSYNTIQNNININIDNSRDPEKIITTSELKISPRSENNITISSAGVSINVLNSCNELKISCKTTPPKKRYSVYTPPEDLIVPAAENNVNLSAKFSVETPKTTTTTVSPDSASAFGNSSSRAGGAISVRQQLIEYRQGIADSGSAGSSRFATKCSGSTTISASQLSSSIEGSSRDLSINNATPTIPGADVKPITSTYLSLMRSMGLSDEDALKFDHLVSASFKLLFYITNI